MSAFDRALEVIARAPGPAEMDSYDTYEIASALAEEGLLVTDEIDWRKIADGLYHALGAIEDNTPGGSIGWPHNLVQPAIDAYEYADDASKGQQ